MTCEPLVIATLETTTPTPTSFFRHQFTLDRIFLRID
jgi:hypothetical protein